MKQKLMILAAAIAGLVGLVLVPAASGAAPNKGAKSTPTTAAVTPTTAAPLVSSNTPDLAQPSNIALAAAKPKPGGGGGGTPPPDGHGHCPKNKPNCHTKCGTDHKPACPSQPAGPPGTGGGGPPTAGQPSGNCSRHAQQYDDALAKYNSTHKQGDYNHAVHEHRWLYQHGCATPPFGTPAPTVIVS